jgi:glucose-1-phosphate cytidylyltransferase
MRVVILAGGTGSRLQEQTTVRPKPMVEIGHRPMLWHIMKIYAAHGFREFVLALGYKAEMVREYFFDFHRLHRNVSIDLRDGSAVFHDDACDDWRVHLVDTGLDTETGGRLRRLQPWIGGQPFMMTYGDGVANVDLGKLLAFHKAHGKLATVTAVRPPSRFGGLRLDGDRVAEFEEKPQIGEGWINGGFFVLSPSVLDLIADDHTLWERGPLEHLAATQQLMAYRHDGFWQPMDTMRDVNNLERLWSSGEAPWKVWA